MPADKSFLAWCTGQGWLSENPAAVKGKKRAGTKHSHKRGMLSNAEVRAVLNACPATSAGLRDRAVIALIVYAGLRTVEVFRANVQDMGTKGQRLVLWVLGKNRQDKDEYVIIPPKAEHLLRAWFAVRGDQDGPLFVSLSLRSQGQRLSRSAIRRIVKAYFRAAGIVEKAQTVHSLRHTAITSAIRHGATPMQAQAMSRHDSLNTLLIYYHELDRDGTPGRAVDRL